MTNIYTYSVFLFCFCLLVCCTDISLNACCNHTSPAPLDQKHQCRMMSCHVFMTWLWYWHHFPCTVPLGLQVSSLHWTPRDTPRPTQMACNDTVGYFYSSKEIDFRSNPELRSLNWKVSKHTTNQEGSDILECSWIEAWLDCNARAPGLKPFTRCILLTVFKTPLYQSVNVLRRIQMKWSRTTCSPVCKLSRFYGLITNQDYSALQDAIYL